MNGRTLEPSVRDTASFVTVFASVLIAINSIAVPCASEVRKAGRYGCKEVTTMATPYRGNVTPSAQPAHESGAGPMIRHIGLHDLQEALWLGWEDFKAVPSHAIILCVIYPVL